MDIALLDDNPGFLANGLLQLEQAGYTVAKFSEPAPFKKYALDGSAELVLFVDHDLGRDRVGYEVVRAIRHGRADGLILPVVYLTGRETERGFLAAEADDPHGTPSLYLNKRALVRTDLEALVANLSERYRQARQLAESQAVRQALKFFKDLPDDLIAER